MTAALRTSPMAVRYPRKPSGFGSPERDPVAGGRLSRTRCRSVFLAYDAQRNSHASNAPPSLDAHFDRGTSGRQDPGRRVRTIKIVAICEPATNTCPPRRLDIGTEAVQPSWATWEGSASLAARVTGANRGHVRIHAYTARGTSRPTMTREEGGGHHHRCYHLGVGHTAPPFEYLTTPRPLAGRRYARVTASAYQRVRWVHFPGPRRVPEHTIIVSRAGPDVAYTRSRTFRGTASIGTSSSSTTR
jgi:hypothetical protein